MGSDVGEEASFGDEFNCEGWGAELLKVSREGMGGRVRHGRYSTLPFGVWFLDGPIYSCGGLGPTLSNRNMVLRTRIGRISGRS